MTVEQAGAGHELVLTGPWTPVRELLARTYRSRELIVILGRKNFFVQYRRTSLGTLWSVALPLVQAVLFAVIFSRIGRFSVHHYPVFVFSGMVGWSFFISTLLPGTTSIVDNAGMSSKVYFPRAVLPLSLCVGAMYSLLVSIGVLVVFAAGMGADFGARILLLVPAIALDLALTTALCLVLSVSYVYLRDTRYVVQAASIVWMWVTPVVYPLSSVNGWVHTLLVANPMTGVVQLFHASLIAHVGSLAPVGVSVAWTVALSVLGVLLHARYDRVVSDLL